MKNYSISLFAALMLFFYASTFQAQNQSSENSNAITFHQSWVEELPSLCPDIGPSTFTLDFHVVYKWLPNTKDNFKYHYNIYEEGVDENGDLWKAHDTWIGEQGKNVIRKIIVQGPKGAKLKMC